MNRKMYIRLDDACPKRNVEKWNKMESLLDKYNIIPLVGIIPDCKDPEMDKYEEDSNFWSNKVPTWIEKGWIIGLHGYEHVFHTSDGGINPVNQKSEFAGLDLEKQKHMIRNGMKIMHEHGVSPQVFFAPAHTFDYDTLMALKTESDIRFISDTPANDVYMKNGFTFIPQQSGKVRLLPFKTITFCYHPNIMKKSDFEKLDQFIAKNKIDDFQLRNNYGRKLNIIDKIMMATYYWKHRTN